MSESKNPSLLAHLDTIFERTHSNLMSLIQYRRQVLRVVTYPRDPNPHEPTEAPKLNMPPFTSVGEAIAEITNVQDLINRQEHCLAEELRQSYIELANHIEHETATVSDIEGRLDKAREFLALNGYRWSIEPNTQFKAADDGENSVAEEDKGTPVAWSYLNNLSAVTERTLTLSGHVLTAMADLTYAMDPLAHTHGKADPVPVDQPIAGVIDV